MYLVRGSARFPPTNTYGTCAVCRYNVISCLKIEWRNPSWKCLAIQYIFSQVWFLDPSLLQSWQNLPLNIRQHWGNHWSPHYDYDYWNFLTNFQIYIYMYYKLVLRRCCVLHRISYTFVSVLHCIMYYVLCYICDQFVIEVKYLWKMKSSRGHK